MSGPWKIPLTSLCLYFCWCKFQPKARPHAEINTGQYLCCLQSDYYKEREIVRTKAYEHAVDLKRANLGISTQCPKQIREARKPLYTIMEQVKAKGNTVKLVKDKLYINGKLYKPAEPMATETSS